ncbi:unnamed protein product [Absidia cylindrospora]
MSQQYTVESFKLLEKYSNVAAESGTEDLNNILRNNNNNNSNSNSNTINTNNNDNTTNTTNNDASSSTSTSTSIIIEDCRKRPMIANDADDIDDDDEDSTVVDISGKDQPIYDFKDNTTISNLYHLAFKKFKGIKFNSADQVYLQHAATLPSDPSISLPLRKVVLDLLGHTDLNNIEIALLKTSLSNTINLLNPAMIRLLKPYLDSTTEQHLEQRTNHIVTQFMANGLSEASGLLYDELMRESSKSIDEGYLLQVIYQKKAALMGNKKRDDELCILEYVLEGLDDWSSTEDESELTICRRFAAILDRHCF